MALATLEICPRWVIHRAPESDSSVVVHVHEGRAEPHQRPFNSLQDAWNFILDSGGQFSIGRDAGDAPSIIETWL